MRLLSIDFSRALPKIYEQIFTYNTMAKTERAKEDMDERTASDLAELFRAIGDTSRVRILAAVMTRECKVGDIAAAVGNSESAVSHHLRHLRQMRLVRARKAGREVFYSLDDDHVVALFKLGLEHVRHG